VDTLSYKTKSANKETVSKEWFLVDATNEPVGRLSSKVAKILRGKNKPYFTPHIDCGDNVIIINADMVRFTGKKLTDKQYVSHSGYPGGQKIQNPKTFFDKQPEKILEKSIKGMLPRNRLGRAIYKNLFIYRGIEHPHEGQKPKELKLNAIK
jgi:large subunit ribosomal protein L13